MTATMTWSFCANGTAVPVNMGRTRWCWALTRCCMRSAETLPLCPATSRPARRTGTTGTISRSSAWRTAMDSAQEPSRPAAMFCAWISTEKTRSCGPPGSAITTTSRSMPMANCSASTAIWSGTGARHGIVRCGPFMPCAAAITGIARAVPSGRSIMPTVCLRR